MAGTRKARVPMAEQIRLINECRQSGMTDADWCRENDIAVSTFYTVSYTHLDVYKRQDYSFIEKLLPWSGQLPEICRSKSKTTNV